jgi:pyrroline-5-carboxylate reductase
MRKARVKSTVFLGGGRITAALISGLKLAGYQPRIVVHDYHPGKLRTLSKEYGVVAEPNLQAAVAAANLLIVAVRPASVRELLGAIGRVNRPLLAISLAAGIPLSLLQSLMGSPVRWVRAMPSPVCRSGAGLTALAFPRRLSAVDRGITADFFAKVGQVVVVPEKQFDVFTATYSSSHGYHALATLAAAAEKLGLHRKLALAAAAHALADGICAWRAGKTSLDALIEEAATPGGIAATVMSVMDKGGFGRLVENSLRAGVARARANARP